MQLILDGNWFSHAGVSVVALPCSLLPASFLSITNLLLLLKPLFRVTISKVLRLT